MGKRPTFVLLRRGRWTSTGTVGWQKKDQLRKLRNVVSRLLTQGFSQQPFGQAKEIKRKTEEMIQHAVGDNNEAHKKIVEFVRYKHVAVLPSLYKTANQLKNFPERVISLKAVFSNFNKTNTTLLIIPGRRRCVLWELLVREEARRRLEINGVVRAINSMWITDPSKTSTEARKVPETRLDKERSKRLNAVENERKRRKSFWKKVHLACAHRGVTVDDFNAAVAKMSASEAFRAYVSECELDMLNPAPRLPDSPLMALRSRNPRNKWYIHDGIHKWLHEKDALAHHETLPRPLLKDFDDHYDQVVAEWHRWTRPKVKKLVAREGGGWGRRDVEKEAYYKAKIENGTLSDHDVYDLRQEKLTPLWYRDPPKKYRMYRQYARREGLYF